MTSATIDGVPRERERIRRYEFNVEFWGQFGIALTGLAVIAIKLLHYGYGEGHWALPTTILGLPETTIKSGLGVASIVLDGAGTAALLSITAAVILRIDIYKVVDRIINAPPTMLDPETVERLGRIREEELSTKIAQLEAKLAEDTANFRRLLQEGENRLQEAEIRREALQERLDGDRGVFDKLATALTSAAAEAKAAKEKS